MPETILANEHYQRIPLPQYVIKQGQRKNRRQNRDTETKFFYLTSLKKKIKLCFEV